jgi:hypothetical protein
MPAARVLTMFRYDFEGQPFSARDADGKEYVLTPLYRLKPGPEGRVREESPDCCVGLRTDVWQWVAREAKGRYLITDTDPATVLSSDDPRAV